MVVAEFKNDNYTSVYGLKQWDFGQELLIKGTGIQGKTVEVHFALERDDVALRMLGTVENGNITVLIPDTLLQIGNSIYAYVYQSGETAGKTTHKIFMHVSPRAKPEDYTEKEFKNALQQVLAIAQSVREDADAGKFNATDEQIRKVVETYMSNHPIEKIETDKTLSIEGQAADAKATGDKFLQYAIKNTVTGESPVAITDSAEEKLQDLKLFGRTEQITTTGKNLLSNNPKDWNIGLGLSWSGNKGDPINTVNTLESSFIYLNVKSNTKYSFINLKKSKIWVTRIIERNAEEAGLVNHVLYKDESVNKEKYTFTTTTETKSIIFQIKNVNTNNAMTETDIKYNEIMFHEGENVPYEPNTGEKPSPSPDYPQEIKNVGKYNEVTGKYDVEVMISGKNLLDISAWEDGKTLNANGDIVNHANALLTHFIPCFPKTSYCRAKGHFTVVSFYDVEKNKIGFINQYDSCFTTPDKCRYFRFALNKTKADYEKAVANVGKELAEYEPYREPQTVKLSLDQPLRGIGEYKDEVTKDGVVRRIKKITLNGSEDWILHNNTRKEKTQSFGLVIPVKCYAANVGLMSNRFLKRYTVWMGDIEGIDIYGGYTLYINIEKTKASSVEEFKKWLSENQVTVEVILAEPIIEPLPEEFEQFLKLNSYYPTTVITADGGEVNSDIEVTYVADTKNYIDNKVSTNVANIISQYQTNISNLLSLMPTETQATMIENDTNNILESEVIQ